MRRSGVRFSSQAPRPAGRDPGGARPRAVRPGRAPGPPVGAGPRARPCSHPGRPGRVRGHPPCSHGGARPRCRSGSCCGRGGIVDRVPTGIGQVAVREGLDSDGCRHVAGRRVLGHGARAPLRGRLHDPSDCRVAGRADRVRGESHVHDDRPLDGARSRVDRPAGLAGLQGGDAGRWRGRLRGHVVGPLRRQRDAARDVLAVGDRGECLRPAVAVHQELRRHPGRGPVGRHLPFVLLRPEGGQVLSVGDPPVVGRPERRQSHGHLLRGHRLQLRARGQPGPGHLVQRGAEHVDRRREGHLPARRQRVRDPGVRRRPAVLGQRLRRDGELHGSGALDLRRRPHRGERRPHRIGPAVLLPGPGGAGARRHDLHGRPAVHHGGHVALRRPAGVDDTRGRPRFRRLELRPGERHLLFPERPTLRRRRRRHLVVHADQRHRLPRRRPGTVGQAGLGRRALDPGHRQLLRPGDDAHCGRHLRPVVDVAGGASRTVVLGGERGLPRRRDGAGPHRDGPADHGHQTRLDPPDLAVVGHRPGALRGPGVAARHLDLAPHHPRDDVPALHGGGHGRRPRLRHPALGLGLGRPGRPPGRGPQRPAGPGRPAQHLDDLLELGAPRLQRCGPHGGHLRGLGADLRRVEHRPLQGGLRGRPGPPGLLDPGQRGGPGVDRPGR